MGKKAQAARARARKKDQEDNNGTSVLGAELAALQLSPQSERKKLSKAQKRARELEKQMIRMNQYDAERGNHDLSDEGEAGPAEEEAEETDLGTNTRGLRNLGNTCFFNSVLQNLAHLETVQTALINPSPPPTAGKLLGGFRSTCKAIRAAQGKGSVNPKELLREITKRAPMFKGNDQQAAGVALRFYYLFDP